MGLPFASVYLACSATLLAVARRAGAKPATGKASRYSTIKVIGRGSFGTAYLVRRTLTPTPIDPN